MICVNNFGIIKIIFFLATWSRCVKSERKKNMSAPNCVISIWQFARGRWITHELPFNNSAKKCWNVRKLSHRLSLSLSIACSCERARVSEYAWVRCVCVMYRCECYCWWMLFVDWRCWYSEWCVSYTQRFWLYAFIKSTPKSQILTYSILVFVQLPIWHLVHCFSKSSVDISIVSVDVGSQIHFIICIVVIRNSGGPTNFHKRMCVQKSSTVFKRIA